MIRTACLAGSEAFAPGAPAAAPTVAGNRSRLDVCVSNKRDFHIIMVTMLSDLSAQGNVLREDGG